MSTFLAFRMAAASVLRPNYRPSILLHHPIQTQIRTLKKDVRQHPKNSQIPYEVVQIMTDPSNPNALSHPQKLSTIIQNTNLNTHLVRLMSTSPPTVVIVSKLDDKIRKLEKKESEKALERRKIESKDVQLTWVTNGGDLEHKLSKVREELERGDVRVNVIFMPKSGVKSPPRHEMDARLTELLEMFADTSNEWKARVFARGGATLFLQSTVRREQPVMSEEEKQERAREKTGHLERQALRTMKKKERMEMEEEERRESLPDLSKPVSYL